MWSKKMAFSLMRLITILAFAVVVPVVMAQENNIRSSLDVTDDISHKDGFQMEYLGLLGVTIQFDKPVDLTPTDLLIIIFDENGAFLESPTPASVSISRSPTDIKKWSVGTNSVLPPAARHIKIRVAAGVESTDPSEDSRTEGGDYAIELLEPDPALRPDVYQIALVGFPFATITTATFQVHVLLSEEPKDGFTADLLEVTNASVTSVVRLVSPGPSATVNETTVHASWRDHNLYSYLVTFETQWGEETVTIKIKNFAGMEKPIFGARQEMYVRAGDSALVEGKDILTLKTNRDSPRTEVITIYVPEDATPPVDRDAITATEEPTVMPVPTTEEGSEAEVPDTFVAIPMEGRIYISEIMFAGGGFLPQWIEISNGSRTEQVNLSGWIVQIESAHADANVPTMVKFKIPGGTKIDPSGQHDTPSTILIVSKQGRNNLEGAMAEGQVVKQDRQWSLSDMAFRITLAPPSRVIFTDEQAAARAAVTDVVGNLTEDGTVAWALPMNEVGPRSSMIRRHVSGEAKDGTMMDAWVLASDTGFTQDMHGTAQSYYGFSTDVGTPGFRAGGALPVELSHFRPARDKATGAVVITWSTQSELNNAGFFIKRSQQRNGQFKVINATMVPGAGTTSEKQFYTFTDTTAQPNVVYYYQIEDVSLDGNRQTLTNGIRLKGHIGAAGKLTTSWGELKSIQ